MQPKALKREWRCLLILLSMCLFIRCSRGTPTNEVHSSETTTETLPSPESQRYIDSLPLDSWQVQTSRYAKLAFVKTQGQGPNGEIQTLLRLQCPTTENSLTNIEYSVVDVSSIPEFDFDSFEGPGAPNLTKPLVEFVWGTQKWTAAVAGWFGDPDIFVFSPSTFNKPDQTNRIARTLAAGTTGLTVIAHDRKDWNRTLRTTFPPIDQSSNVAEILNGCGKL